MFEFVAVSRNYAKVFVAVFCEVVIGGIFFLDFSIKFEKN